MASARTVRALVQLWRRSRSLAYRQNPAGPLDAEEIGFGAGARLFEEEGSLAGTDFQFDGMIVAEQILPDDWLGKRIGKKADAVNNERAVGLHERAIIRGRAAGKNARGLLCLNADSAGAQL